MKRLGAIVIAVALVVASLPMPTFGTIQLNNDGSFELTEILITEVASGYGAGCNTESDFVELYASKDIVLSEYQLYAKASSGSKTIALPDIEVSAGAVVLIGCVAGSDKPTDVNLIKSNGAIWVTKNDVEIDRAEYSTMESGESFERDICGNSFAKSNEKSPGVFNALVECEAIPEPPPQYCGLISISEIEANDKWVELHNDSDIFIEPENLAGCVLAVQEGNTSVDPVTGLDFRKYNKTVFALADYGEIAPGEYFIVDIIPSGLTLPSSSGIKNRSVVVNDLAKQYSIGIYGSHKVGTSWILSEEVWQLTYAVTPQFENVFQPYPNCDVGYHVNDKNNCVKDAEPPAECAEGQFRNPETGRCKKIAVETSLAECAEGQFRNPETNRCKKLASENVLAECAEGQFRNPATNRCKKIASGDDLVPCAEGYERNPETNRCRKIPVGEDALYGVDPVGGGEQSSIWIWAGIGGVALLGGLVAWQFRPEISRGFRRLVGKSKKG
jgi:hypothetical protein